MPTHEVETATECRPWNALKFGTAGEVDSKERVAHAEGLFVALSNISEVGSPQEELNRAIGEVLITQPAQQRPRTKLIFDVRIDNPFLD